MADPTAYLFLLRGVHLFPGLDDEKLWQIVEQMGEQTFSPGEVIFNQGDKGDTFYIIARGKVGISHKLGGKDTHLATLVKGDYFGEFALLRKTPRNATARAETDLTVLTLKRESFRELFRTIPRLELIFRIVTETRSLVRKMKFEWKSENEVVYFISKKHPYNLAIALTVPVIMVFVGALMFILGAGMTTSAVGDILWWVAFPLMVIGLLYGIWQYIDWDNDYYVITNQRVVEVQKIVGIYDSRKEAPLNMIVSVSVETPNWISRSMDFGDVVVSTFTGKIRMIDVDHPRQVSTMIDEFWRRAKQSASEEQLQGLKKSIKDRIAPPPPAKPSPTPADKTKKPAPKKPTLTGNWFSLRDEEGGTIVYHKHWFVLVEHIFYRLLTLAAIIAGMIGVSMYFPDFNAVVILLGLSGLGVLGWILWGYIDWQNDLYMVTDEQILDIYREPLGREDRRSAQLVNILSVEFEREGIIHNLFNFGTVKISIGGGQFDFVDVANPPLVQSDIIQRVQKAQARKREADNAAEKNRMLDWIAMYHNTLDEMRKAGDDNPGMPKPE